MAPSKLAPIRAVCDTNVLVPHGHRQYLLEAASFGLFRPLWSPWIIGELYRVLTWQWVQKHGASETERRLCSTAANALMALLLPDWELINIAPPWPKGWSTLRDPYDLPIIATALKGHARYIVSENTHDFPPADAAGRHVWQNLEFLRIADFLEIIGMDYKPHARL